MAKVNLDFQITQLGGKPIDGDGGHAGRMLATVLYHSNSGKSIKFSAWAMTWYNKEVAELDETDLDVLIQFIETYGTNPQQQGMIMPNFTDGIKAQIIKVLKKILDELKNPKPLKN
jgi:hypothetical protein